MPCSPDDYYVSFAKQNAFKCLEKWFRMVQSTLLLFMIFCFIFYLITLGMDISKYMNHFAYLFITVLIDLLAMIFIALGVRGVALEVLPFVVTFTLTMVLVTIGHGVTFIFRHQGLNSANFIFDLLLSVYGILYTVLLCRFDRMKPADYDVRRLAADATADELETVNSDANNSITTTVTATVGAGATGAQMATENATETTEVKSPTESRMTDISGIDIAGIGLESGQAPIANFTSF